MAMKKTLHPFEQQWVEARYRHRLTHAQVQMARELGMNPQRLSQIDDHRDKEWKAPLPQYIEQQYLKKFGKEQPDSDMSVEDRVKLAEAKKSAKRQKKRIKRSLADAKGSANTPGSVSPPLDS